MRVKPPSRPATIADVDARVEKLAVMTAAGFTEVHEKIDALREDMNSFRKEMQDSFKYFTDEVRLILKPMAEDLHRHGVEITDLQVRTARIEREMGF